MRKTYMILAVGFITLVMSGAYRNGAAADYPTRPIEIICPNAAGGGMDFVHDPVQGTRGKDHEAADCLPTTTAGLALGALYAEGLYRLLAPRY